MLSFFKTFNSCFRPVPEGRPEGLDHVDNGRHVDFSSTNASLLKSKRTVSHISDKGLADVKSLDNDGHRQLKPKSRTASCDSTPLIPSLLKPSKLSIPHDMPSPVGVADALQLNVLGSPCSPNNSSTASLESQPSIQNKLMTMVLMSQVISEEVQEASEGTTSDTTPRRDNQHMDIHKMGQQQQQQQLPATTAGSNLQLEDAAGLVNKASLTNHEAAGLVNKQVSLTNHEAAGLVNKQVSLTNHEASSLSTENPSLVPTDRETHAMLTARCQSVIDLDESMLPLNAVLVRKGCNQLEQDCDLSLLYSNSSSRSSSSGALDLGTDLFKEPSLIGNSTRGSSVPTESDLLVGPTSPDRNKGTHQHTPGIIRTRGWSTGICSPLPSSPSRLSRSSQISVIVAAADAQLRSGTRNSMQITGTNTLHTAGNPLDMDKELGAVPANKQTASPPTSGPVLLPSGSFQARNLSRTASTMPAVLFAEKMPSFGSLKWQPPSSRRQSLQGQAISSSQCNAILLEEEADIFDSPAGHSGHNEETLSLTAAVMGAPNFYRPSQDDSALLDASHRLTSEALLESTLAAHAVILPRSRRVTLTGVDPEKQPLQESDVPGSTGAAAATARRGSSFETAAAAAGARRRS
ncbi:hypothetical protein CEUSTIGMA_g1798.t1 [Chlamydomonas eustigma]|uniref:Uncharacterized protein n=1 Tax=Chlamydomonas eustigma TaxID=1157962 RepID=A0A250WUF7_9CHLO|nr:hypothetical protein CEUSTIGMA_g1798.t1 [Chlamydomonas eustigma]|eukprot:GAX74349.1 hypothetical protein CEUSTIGMA_g1798.t1 [Chlamydomonas eustigma]